ncbi:hypothetical protein E4U57_007150 [Claviceps arundinis]|uniref:Methyltransferase type 11 domain-containing protein n=1 Tax=Claviceps arundinis TaxID=1623583 RepID=A0ABQ7PMA9_9HYPO|nr:hypothetical protein E4U57_007150 [Claviceps arundinis]
MSGGLNAGIVPSTPGSLHSATNHGTGDEAILASSCQHSVVSPMTISSSTGRSETSGLYGVSSPEAKKAAQVEYLGTSHEYQKPFERLVDGTMRPPDLRSPARRSFNFSHGFSQQTPRRNLTYADECTVINEDTRVHQVPPARSPLRPGSCQPEGYQGKQSVNDVSSWRKPRDWTLTTLISLPTRLAATARGDEPILSKELVKEVEKMARAPTAIALAKLKQPYDISMSIEDLEKLSHEKERWMLSTLQHLDRNEQQSSKAVSEAAGAGSTGQVEPRQKQTHNVLAFYEPQWHFVSPVSARYLAAFWPHKDVHHLSDRPLSFKAAPNLHAIFKPSICTPFPELADSFDAVHSMLLPALCKASEMPGVLHNIHKCLKPGGSLNLIVIDSIPHVDAFGAKMRAWFMENLVLNIRQQSRSINPSLILPDLLSKASLRATGSVLTTTQFYANPQNIGRHGAELDGTARSVNEDKELRAELRSIAGRILWKEVWGQFVTSDTWWWEEADCMQECLELGTFWEYHFVQAVKAAS